MPPRVDVGPQGMSLALFGLLVVSAAVHGQTWGGCTAAGSAVPTVHDFSTKGPAYGGGGKIVLNPTVMRSYSPSMQKFIYWHECGHVMLGHTGSSASNEMAADCIAFKYLQSTDKLSRKEIMQIARDMSKIPGDRTHMPGPERVDRLLSCNPG
jgi:hypothetical protein